MRDACERLGFVPAQPCELGDRERRHRDGADGIGPGRRAPRVDERVGLRCRFGVVPELGGTEHATLVVEHDHPVLLAGDRHRFDVMPVFVEQRRECLPPRVRILFAARRRRRGMGSVPTAYELAGVDVAHLDLARLRGGVDSRDQRHASTSDAATPASNASSTAPAIAASPSMPLATTGTCSASSASRASAPRSGSRRKSNALRRLAADDNQLRVEDADEVRSAEAQHVPGFFEHPERAFVTFPCCPHDVGQPRGLRA